MGTSKMNRFFVVLLAGVVALALFALPGCGKVKEKAAGAAEIALGAVEKGAEIAGEATANWLGTTAGNVGKEFNETIAERFGYLEITVDEISRAEVEPKPASASGDPTSGDPADLNEDAAGTATDPATARYTIKLTINNTAPDKEKMYTSILLGDYYLTACDQNDYTYSLTADQTAGRPSDLILPGKSKLTVYTDLAASDKLAYLLFIGDKIPLPPVTG